MVCNGKTKSGFRDFSAVAVLRGVPECSGVFRSVPECSGVPECSVVFRGVPVFRCSGVPVFRCSGVPGFSTCPFKHFLDHDFHCLHSVN